jgi:hypothetical protein
MEERENTQMISFENLKKRNSLEYLGLERKIISK